MKDIQPDLQEPGGQILPISPVYIPITNPVENYFQTNQTQYAQQSTTIQHAPFTGIPKVPFSSAGGLPPGGNVSPGPQGAFRDGMNVQGTMPVAQPIYIPAYYLEYARPTLQRKEPGIGETLLGCGLLLLIGIIGIAVLYFLSGSAM